MWWQFHNIILCNILTQKHAASPIRASQLTNIRYRDEPLQFRNQNKQLFWMKSKCCHPNGITLLIYVCNIPIKHVYTEYKY